MRGLGRRWTTGLALALTLRLCAPAAHADEQLEYTIKAELIERFTHFIDWPNEAFASDDVPFTLCILGETPLTPRLQFVLARDHHIKERHAELRSLKSDDKLDGCQLVFIGGNERARIKEILQRVDGRPILTVADSEGFAHQGVLINLYVDEGNHVRYEICNEGIKRSGLKLSPLLLRFARIATEAGP